ncbi:MAG: NAD(P)-binding protein [Myxococcota bacterium]
MSARRRVLVLGGGCGGVAAAWALTRTPERRARTDVTLVQAGWRLGGKGATGRDPARGQRVLEHGLHLWLGWYRSAFAFLRDVYEAREEARGLLRSLDTAFSSLHDTVLRGGDDDAPEYWRLSLPPTPGRPWDDDDAPLDWAALLAAWARRLPAALAPLRGDPGWTAGRLAAVGGLVGAVARGAAREIVGRPDAWERLDEEDLRAWLARHGATPAQADLPLVRALYDLGFAYPDGRPGGGRGAMAAGAGLKALLRTVASYRGAPFWRMNAGMGDTVFAPAYRVLRERGVRFRFFHRLDRLGVRGGAVDEVELGVQADAPDYEPLVRVGELDAWPDRPRFDRLHAFADGDPEADDGPSLGRVTLRRGEDFDDVVLAVPSTAHRRVAAALMDANPRYRAMVEHTCAVPTVAAQLWLARGTGELGWPGTPPVCTGLPGLFRTWADMSGIADAEAHAERPGGIAYLCGVAPPALFGATDRAAASAWVADRLRDEAAVSLGPVWPFARRGERLDDGVLSAPPGADPWREQYARANVAAWERYVLTLPGSTKHRLGPGESGFVNLVLAGDWTRTAVNGGCVEAAVTSGVEAADVLLARG